MATLTTSWQSLGSATLYSGTTIHLDGRYDSQNTANNSSKIQFRLRSVGTSWRTTSGTAKFTGTYTDSGSSATYPSYVTDGSTVFSIEKTVTHNTDGTKTLSIGGSVDAIINSAKRTATISNKSVTIPKINRLATVTSATDFTDEGNPTVTFNNPAGFTVKPYINFYDNNNTLLYQLYRDVSASSPYNWEITSAERTAIRNTLINQPTYRAQMGVDTYNGSSKLGYDSTARTITFVNATPSQLVSRLETNQKVIDLLGDQYANKIIQNASQLSLSCEPTAYKGATIKSVSLYHEGKLYQTITSAPYNFNVFTIRTNSFSVVATDSRGFTSTANFEYTDNYIPYLPVDILTFSFKRYSPTSADIILNSDITYSQKTFNTTPNAPTIKWKKGEGGTLNTLSSSDYTIDVQNNKITISNLGLTNALAYNASDYLCLYVEDLLTTDSDSVIVTKGIPTIEAGEHDFQVNGQFYIANTDRTNQKEIRDLIYPVGSIYMSVNSTNPAMLFGGTWEQIKDTFLLSAGDTYTAGNSGGSATKTLSLANMPSHNHDPAESSHGFLTYVPSKVERVRVGTNTSGRYAPLGTDTSSATNSGLTYDGATNYKGSGTAFNIMPPYLTVYMWKRTG